MLKAIARATLPALRLLCASCVSLAACAAGDELTIPETNVRVDEVDVVEGVADESRDPAVVAIDVDGDELCTAVLIASDAALTARHCVSRIAPGAACPATGAQVLANRDPATLRILGGDDAAVFLARGRLIVAPLVNVLCGADIAVLLLDRPVDGVAPLPVRAVGVATGARVRTVGFGRLVPGSGSPAATLAAPAKLLREHVLVADTTLTEFRVREGPCQGDSSGPALDEGTGAILGVVSRPGPACAGADAYDVYTRADAFASLIEDGLSLSASAGKGASHTVKLATDIGDPCEHGSDCGTGACVDEESREYCSRACDGQDKCPTDYTCKATEEGSFVCVDG
jgi:hypothetical protein